MRDSFHGDGKGRGAPSFYDCVNFILRSVKRELVWMRLLSEALNLDTFVVWWTHGTRSAPQLTEAAQCRLWHSAILISA